MLIDNTQNNNKKISGEKKIYLLLNRFVAFSAYQSFCCSASELLIVCNYEVLNYEWSWLEAGMGPRLYSNDAFICEGWNAIYNLNELFRP